MMSACKRLFQAILFATPAAHADDRQFDRRSIELVARVAHEALQPLSAARAAFELIRRSTSDAQRERGCAVIERQFVRLTRIFDDLLEASRLYVGKTTLRLEQLDFRGLVDEVSESVRPLVTEKDQRIASHLPDEPVWIEGDSGRLQQVVSNLLVNGIKYTDRGGRVSIDLVRREAEVMLTVSDTGRGISHEVLPRIFEPFVRGDSASEEGLGVGLAIARQFVELHGGTIRASSAGPGSGSAFVVTLPSHPATYGRGNVGRTGPAASDSSRHVAP
jgi:signal transduction histidine kinase